MDEWRQFAELANPDGWFWKTDREHRFVWLSESFETIAGISREELIGACRADINAPITNEGDWEAHLLALENRESFQNFVFKPKNQHGQIWASISGTPIWDENGAFQGYRGLGHVLDGPIEPADRASTLAKVVDEVDATIAIWDGADRLVYYNETFLRYHSAIAHIINQPISYERCLRESVAAGIFPEEVDRLEEFIASRIAQHQNPGPPQEVIRGDGRAFQITQQVLSDGTKFTIGVDITEQKKLTEDLRVALDRLNDFAEVSADWFWEQDADLRFTYMYESRYRGPDPSRLGANGKTRRETDIQGVTEEQWKEHDATLARREPLVDFRAERPGPDGKVQIYSVNGRPFYDNAGDFAGYRGTGRDITEHVKLVQQLKEAQARLEQVLEQTPIAVIKAAPDGNISYVNQRLESLLGVTREEVQGRPVSSLYTDPAERQQVVKIVARDRQLRDHEVSFRAKAGQDIPVLLSAQAAPGEDGSLIGWAIDISERKNAEQDLKASQRRFQDFAEAASDWFWETNAEHRYTYFSGLMEEITGFDAAKLIGQNRRKFLTSSAVADRVLSAHLDDVDALRAFRDVRIKFTREDGEPVWFNLSGRPSFDKRGSFLGYRGSGDDITAQVDLEIAAKEALEEARGANLAKSQFLSSMSHELRTPLNSILGFGQLLGLESEQPLSKEQTEGVEQILKAGNHLLELINQVLDLSRIEQGHLSMSIEYFDPSEVLEDCQSLVARQAGERGISLERSGLENHALPMVRADKVRLKQVLLNLLMNAVKYNSTGTRIGIDCALGHGGSLRFDVWDDGPGIPLGKREEVFKPFNRLGMESLDIEGTGIGLTISRELVELMDGNLECGASAQGGALFRFDLPTSVGTGEARIKRQQNVHDAPVNETEARRKVLYIEDNPANLLLVRRIVEQLGDVKFLSAHTAEIGIAIIRAERPDLVLMDINLPGISGIDAMRVLQASTDMASIPVIVISAAAMPHDLEQARDEGFANYLTKPLDVPKALRVIGDILETVPTSKR